MATPRITRAAVITEDTEVTGDIIDFIKEQPDSVLEAHSDWITAFDTLVTDAVINYNAVSFERGFVVKNDFIKSRAPNSPLSDNINGYEISGKKLQLYGGVETKDKDGNVATSLRLSAGQGLKMYHADVGGFNHATIDWYGLIWGGNLISSVANGYKTRLAVVPHSDPGQAGTGIVHWSGLDV